MFQIEVWKSQESFTYFKIFKLKSWGKRPTERRSRLIQRFLKFSQEIKKENAAQELPRGVTVSGSLADATSAASTNSIRQEGQKSQGGFSKNRASLENCKSSNLHRARKKAASRLLFGDPLEVTNGLLTRKKRSFKTRIFYHGK